MLYGLPNHSRCHKYEYVILCVISSNFMSIIYYAFSESETNDEETQCCLLKLATNIQTLSSHCTVWANMYVKEQRHSRVIQDLTTKLKEHVKVMGNHVVRFFQGWGNDIDSLICDSGSKIVDCVLTVCKLTGEMCLATDMNIISFEQLNCEEADKNQVCFVVCLKKETINRLIHLNFSIYV